MDILPPSSASKSSGHRGWWRELTRYHWFVFVVASLGWLFDTMDQQLFNLARKPAMNELLTETMKHDADWFGGITTSIFLIGWATGGLAFGVMGDRVGRAKTMLLTILLYSLCTGLSAFSTTVWDFALYRFLTGLGVGGEFAVGVSLVAEVMPDRARPFALGLLQALSAVGNVIAALIGIGLGQLEQTAGLGAWMIPGTDIKLTVWRMMFVIGTLPALLALLIRRRLKEPERWQEVAEHAAGKKLGSYRELLGDPRWRKRAIVGLLLATSGVIGVWGIGFFSPDLTRSVFRKLFEADARAAGEAKQDQQFVLQVMRDPGALSQLEGVSVPKGNQLLSLTPVSDARVLYEAILELHDKQATVSVDSILVAVGAKSSTSGAEDEDRARRREYLTASVGEGPSLKAHAERIANRSADINGRLTKWAGMTLFMFHIAGFFGMYGFSLVTHVVGRRLAFAISFLLAGGSTVFVFSSINTLVDVYWMVPLMGLCQMTVFGGYAIYFPELFPTRLRSTGTSFCYNVGRFLAALGPFTLGYLSTGVFSAAAEPMRWAGVSMCAVYLIGLLALPFAPETSGQPLPE